MVVQGAGDVPQVEAQANLLQVARIGTQQRHVTPRQAGGQHQAVEGVVLGVAADDVDERVLQGIVELLDIQAQPFAVGEGEVMYPELTAAGMAQPIGELAQHAQAEVFQDRQDIRQRQRRVGVVQLAVQGTFGDLGQRLVEAHGQRLAFRQRQHVLQVDHRGMRGEALAVAGREALGEVGEDIGALGFAEVLHHQRRVIVVPRAAGLDHFLFQQLRIDVDTVLRIDSQNQLHPRQDRLGEERPELAVAGLQPVHQHLLDLLSHFGGVDLARHIGQAVAEAAVRVLAQEHADLVALLDLHDRHHGAEQFVDRCLEQVVARQHFEHLGQFLAQVRLGIEARTALDFSDLDANVGNGMHAFAIHRRGVQAHEAAFLDDLAGGVQLADRHVVRIGRAMHPAWQRGLGERQQQRLVEVGHGVVFDAQLFSREAYPQAPWQAEERLFVVDHLAAATATLDGELFVAEEGEMVVQQPFEESLDLALFMLRRAKSGLFDLRHDFTQLGLHRFEIGNRDAHFGQHLLDLAGQHRQFGGIRATVDLQVHQRLMAHAFAVAALGQQFEQFALGAAAHAQHRGLQGVDAVAAAVEFGADRVDQERQVMVQHLDHGVGRLPAIAFVIGVVHPYLRVFGVETLDDAPG
ncbi:hypothetical protein D3C79_638850 [compost metagenome]